MEKGGTSGFMWGVNEGKAYTYPYQTGPEIQIIDTQAYDTHQEHQGGELEVNNVITELVPTEDYLTALCGQFPTNNKIHPHTAVQLTN